MKRKVKTGLPVLLLILSFFRYCRYEEREFPQIQSILFPVENHTHEIVITGLELQRGKRVFETSETLGHRHKVEFSEEEAILLMKGVPLEKETTESLGHRHRIKVSLFEF